MDSIRRELFPYAKQKKLFLTALCTLAACVLPLLPLDKPVQARRYERIVVCSDIHYGSKTREPELRARKIATKKQPSGTSTAGRMWTCASLPGIWSRKPAARLTTNWPGN